MFKHSVTIIVIFVITSFLLLLNEIMIWEIDRDNNYKYEPTYWQQNNKPMKYCPKGDTYLECSKFKKIEDGEVI